MVARVWSSKNRLGGLTFEEIDQVLSLVESILHTVAAEHGLRQARIDRWRWDQPEIVLSWITQDTQNIAKSIRFDVNDEKDFYHWSVEVNAWKDERQEGKHLRRWRHEQIAVGPPLFGLDDMRDDRMLLIEKVKEAYRTVAGWNLEELTSEHYLGSIDVTEKFAP
jgi:hypothetical protein